MDLKRLSGRAKDLVEKRGGTESLKRDAEELRGIAKGPGSLKDKAKAAAAAIKEPGQAGTGGSKPGAEGTPAAEATPAAERTPAAEATAEERARAEGKVHGEERGKHAQGGAADPAV